MGARAYATDSDVRKLVEKGGFEKKAAETNVEMVDDRVEKATENLASKEFVESEIRGLKEHMDTRLDAQDKSIEAGFKAQDESIDIKINAMKDYMEVKFEAMREYIDLKMALMSKDQRLQFLLLVIAAIALMQGVNWLLENLV